VTTESSKTLDDSLIDVDRRVARRLRVLVVAPSLDILGGQAVQADRLMRRLQDEQSVEVGFLPINPRLPAALRKLQSIKYVRTLVTSLWYVSALLARVPRYDVIHIFSASYFSFVLAPTPALLIANIFGKKTILNYHSGEASDHLARWPSARWILGFADEIAVPSEYLVHVFQKFGLDARAICNTIEVEAFHFRERAPLRPVFLSNRNLETHYGVDCVLRAFGKIQTILPEAKLTVAGAGSQRRSLERLALELQLQNIEFKGKVAHDKAFALYDAADIFLNGSKIDNQPLSFLEAFACGLPVITTNVGGLPDLVDHNRTGLMVPCGDAEAIAEKAIYLLGHPELSTFITRQAREECRKYSWNAVRKQWLALYEAPADEAEESLSQESAMRNQKAEREAFDPIARQ
jgi:L-malate glycosyltransferase